MILKFERADDHIDVVVVEMYDICINGLQTNNESGWNQYLNPSHKISNQTI